MAKFFKVLWWPSFPRFGNDEARLFCQRAIYDVKARVDTSICPIEQNYIFSTAEDQIDPSLFLPLNLSHILTDVFDDILCGGAGLEYRPDPGLLQNRDILNRDDASANYEDIFPPSFF